MISLEIMKTTTDEIPILLPLRKVAEKLSISPETLYRRIRQGVFPEPIKQGNRSFYLPEDVQSYLGNLKRKIS